MIDKNKIAKAARQISENVVDANGFDDSKPTHLAFLDGHIDGFNAGAKWAINEFLKDLWHPADEMPNENNEVICVDKDSRTITYNGIANWWAFCRTHDVTHWLYVDDLLPKEGGEQ